MRASCRKASRNATSASGAIFTLVIAALEAVDGILPTSGSLAYVFCPRQSSHWAPFGRSVDKSVHERVAGLLHRLQRDRQKLRNYFLPGGGAIVETGTKEFAGQLHHEQPLIHCSGTAVIILYGFLSNLDELFKRNADSCSGAHAYSFEDGGSLSSRRFYSQSHAAEALLEVYLQTKASNLLIMLSELQGQYACMIYDSSRKQVFAARCPGGQQPLYFSVDDDGSTSFVNKPIDVPGGESAEDWQEVPPGHFVAGKTPRLQQFALTPEQLYARQYMDSADGDGHMHHSDPIPIKSTRDDHRNSLSNTLKSGEQFDPVFMMSI
ncbi:hypothetical protein WJX77_012289 [Trebouxia sp. C0004]